MHQDAEYPGQEDHRQRVGEPGDDVGGGRRGEGDEEGRPVAEEVSEAPIEYAAQELGDCEHGLDLPINGGIRPEFLGQVL